MNPAQLESLLAQNYNAADFFDALPIEAQTYLKAHNTEITNEDTLYRMTNCYFQQFGNHKSKSNAQRR